MNRRAKRSLRLGSIAAASLLAHALLLALVPRARVLPRQVSTCIELEIADQPAPGRPAQVSEALQPAVLAPELRAAPSLRTSPPRASLEPAPPVHAAREPPVLQPAPAPNSTARAVALDEPAPAPDSSARAAVPDEPAPAPANAAAAPKPLDLSARAAALSVIVRDNPLRSRGDQLSAAMNAQLVAAASARPFAARKLELRRDADGTCHYAGNAIDATILPDGGVRFDDKPGRVERRDGFDEPPAVATTLEDREAPKRLQVSLKYSARGSDAERQWFLHQTEDVRRELADAARDREMRGDERRLRSQLEHLWCDAQRSLAQRKRALFELWNDTSPDAIGARGREIVLEFARTHAPAHSELAFTAQELAVYNAQRDQPGRFDPYAAPL